MRQYISETFPSAQGILETDERGFKHLRNALRVKCGDAVCVRLPDGALCNMAVCKIDVRRKVIVMQLNGDDGKLSLLTEAMCQKTDAAIEWWLFMFVAKPQRMELIIRQAVECGVSNIVPVLGEYSQSGNVVAFTTRAANSRFAKIVREAREQSGSAVDVKIAVPVSVSEVAKLWQEESSTAPEAACAVVMYERKKKSMPLHDVVASHQAIKKVGIAIGCEGGIAPDEIEILCDAGFAPVHFDVNILRCETAALYGIAAMQSAVLERELWCSKK